MAATEKISERQVVADCTHRIALPKAAAHRNKRFSAGGRCFPSNLGLLRYFESVVDLDAEIANGALQSMSGST
jgi:hypothetical protein